MCQLRPYHVRLLTVVQVELNSVAEGPKVRLSADGDLTSPKQFFIAGICAAGCDRPKCRKSREGSNALSHESQNRFDPVRRISRGQSANMDSLRRVVG